MRVVHVSSGSTGGAGNAAKRLHAALLKSGIDSIFLTLNTSDSMIQKKIEIKRKISERILSFLSSRMHNKISRYSFFSTFSISISSAMNQLKKLDKESTVIHIHNWYNILSLEDIYELTNLNYKLVFTLHDQRIFTGGCHFAFSCNGFKSTCNLCPQLIQIDKSKPLKNLAFQKKIFGGRQNIRFIAPSNWIAHEISSSGICAQSFVTKVSNVNPNLSFARKNSLKPNDWLTIGIASVHPYSYIKGGDLLRDLESFIDFRKLKVKIEFLKNFPDNAQDDFWDSIDVLLVPSITDNSPNVIHEAKMIGIPVIGTRVGGIPELLSEPFDQIIDADQIDFEKIINTCQQLLFDVQFDNHRFEMMQRYALYIGLPVDEHISIYSELLENE